MQSAWSGAPSELEKALSLLAGDPWTGEPTCAVHQMSGTSMATPVTAGTVLLVRQYFMDHKYWASLCNKAHQTCMKGAFKPSGYFLKAVMLHSGQAVSRYSDPLHDQEPTRIPSFQLLDSPIDVFQGHGRVQLSNVLPLPGRGGLDCALELYVLDDIKISEGETLRFDIKIVDTRSKNKEKTNDSRDTTRRRRKGFKRDVKDDVSIRELSSTRSSSPSPSHEPLGPIKVTICWYDPPAPLGSSRNLLMHDLDLALVAPNGISHFFPSPSYTSHKYIHVTCKTYVNVLNLYVDF